MDKELGNFQYGTALINEKNISETTSDPNPNLILIIRIILRGYGRVLNLSLVNLLNLENPPCWHQGNMLLFNGYLHFLPR